MRTWIQKTGLLLGLAAAILVIQNASGMNTAEFGRFLLAQMGPSQGVQVTNLKDTLGNSNLSTSSAHTITFTTTNAITAGETLKIGFDPTTDAFSLDSTISAANLTVYGATLVANAGACSGAASEMYPSTDAVAPDKNITFTVCSGDTVAAGGMTIITATSVMANPATAGSYVISVGGTMKDFGYTRVAIIDDVTVTAAVDTTLDFTVAGLGTATTVNSETLTVTTTATSIPFGTLQIGVAKTAGQVLRVSTNARNGFSVKVQEDHNLLSQTGADIDLFTNGATTFSPIAWANPANILNQENTYGHIGLTSDDATLTLGDEFNAGGAGNRWSGSFASPREIFMNPGPSDGTTWGAGTAKVAYKIQIGTLQEAASDYTNNLMYICTPTF
jgi:hypothetical protein